MTEKPDYDAQLLHRFKIARHFAAGILGYGDLTASAEELGVCVRTLRRDARRARQHQDFASWRPKQRGRKLGTRTTTDRVKQIVEREVYAAAGDPRNIALTAREIEAGVNLAGQPADAKRSQRTYRRMAREIEEANAAYFAKKRFGRHGIHDHTLQRGSLEVTAPLQIVMLDHTPLHARILVDIDGEQIEARVWATAARDLYTGVCLSAFLSCLAPSATTVAVCMAMMAIPKTDILRSYDTAGEWDAFGVPLKLYVDGAAELSSETVRNALGRLGGELVVGIPGRPEARGAMERMFRTLNSQFDRLPGATLSNPQDLEAHGGPRPATLTLEQAQRALLNAVTTYNYESYGSDRLPPIMAWKDAVERGVMHGQIPLDPHATFVHFLPRRRCKIIFEGIKLLGCVYRSEYLAGLRWRGVSHVEVAFDPRDISAVWILEEGNAAHRTERAYPRQAPRDMYACRRWRSGRYAAARNRRDTAVLAELKAQRDSNQNWAAPTSAFGSTQEAIEAEDPKPIRVDKAGFEEAALPKLPANFSATPFKGRVR